MNDSPVSVAPGEKEMPECGKREKESCQDDECQQHVLGDDTFGDELSVGHVEDNDITEGGEDDVGDEGVEEEEGVSGSF